MRKSMGGAAVAGANGIVLASKVQRRQTSAKRFGVSEGEFGSRLRRAPMAASRRQFGRPRKAVLLASCAMIRAAWLMPHATRAVVCSNGGAGGNPAGNDGGSANNTACGNGADASGIFAFNVAAGDSTN